MSFVRFSLIALAAGWLSSLNFAMAGSLDLTNPSGDPSVPSGSSITISFTAAQNPTLGPVTPYVLPNQYIFLDQAYNGVPTSLYCVDLGSTIYDTSVALGLGQPYATVVRTDGTVDSLQTGNYGVTGNAYATDASGTVSGGGAIAWLVQHDAPTATTTDDRLGLQAAIWKAEYGAGFDLTGPGVGSLTSQAVFDAYTGFLAGADDGHGGLKVLSVSAARWYSPATQYDVPVQGFVGVVPEPSSFMLALFGIAGVGAPVIRRRRASRV